jgi:tetratricopeptide (TPR) repeat protein
MASREWETDFYSLLGVERNASKESILKAFRQKARLFHPDKNPGSEELMKLLTTAKITLIDSEKRAQYDDNYTTQGEDIPEGEKVFLPTAKRLSESFIENIKAWIEEFKEIEICDNMNVIGTKWSELREALAQICKDISSEDPNSLTKYHKLLNTRKTTSSLKDKLAHLIPDRIWRMDGVNPNRIFFKQTLIHCFGNWKNSGDEYFVKEHYKTALFCYQKASNNAVILEKARHLYGKKKYETSLLYYRYLFGIDEYKPISTLMLLKILLKNFKADIFDIALHAAYEFEKEVKIHKFLHKLILERELIYEAKDAIDIVIRLGDDRSEKMVVKLRDLAKKCEEKDYNELQAFVYAFEFEKVAKHIKEYRCLTVISRLYTELTKGQDISKLPAKYQATLYILRGASLQLENKYGESLKCFREALLIFPMKETASAVSTLLNKDYIRSSTQQLLDEIKLSQVQFPTNHQYLGKLRSSTLLRTVIKYERNVLNQKLTLFEKAMLYIDLTMAYGHPSLMANNFLIAAYFLLKGMEYENDLATKYAYRNTICDLCAAVFFAQSYMDPVTLMHFVKLCLILMNSSHELLRTSIAKNKTGREKKVVNLINPLQEELFSIGNNLISRAIKVNPLMDIPITLSGDVLYIDLVATEFLENFYNFMTENNPCHPWNHLYHYYLLEGSWKEWADNKKFQTYRENCMNYLLGKKEWTLSQVEKVMSWNVINRDSNGWIDTNKLWLNLPSANFTSVEGVVIDVQSGSFELLMSMNPGEPGLINMDDIQEILCNGITHSAFTLDQPETELQSHPFQEMKYGPDSLKNTNYLATLLHADYLLKMFSMGTEVSAKKPFLFREGDEGILQVLPQFLREALTNTSHPSNSSNYGQVHRFWIEARELPYTQSKRNDNEMEYTFGYCPMIVKKHLMKYDSNGRLWMMRTMRMRRTKTRIRRRRRRRRRRGQGMRVTRKRKRFVQRRCSLKISHDFMRKLVIISLYFYVYVNCLNLEPFC